MSARGQVSERVRELFRAGLQVPDIDLDTPLLDYGLDSVRSAEIIIELERAFGVEISDEEASALHTARDVIECVTTKSAHRTGVGA
ncbi:acyl carrier protein [Nocardia bhagyanarayanae]|uniref:Acyl carrier protein n=1 Tax=Nocardia bhagyanarayanae TaxID=1215925 RepID=A0A543FH77_9NOCA|nr:acyl carrier protein [Nocardia bhagyanarayanae]TQM33220.1 acyl carrier protein [Nocardia bhagyanarayanae]